MSAGIDDPHAPPPIPWARDSASESAANESAIEPLFPRAHAEPAQRLEVPAKMSRIQLYEALFPQLDGEPEQWRRLVRRVWGSYWRGECSYRVLNWIAWARPGRVIEDTLVVYLQQPDFDAMFAGAHKADNRVLNQITEDLGFDVGIGYSTGLRRLRVFTQAKTSARK